MVFITSLHVQNTNRDSVYDSLQSYGKWWTVQEGSQQSALFSTMETNAGFLLNIPLLFLLNKALKQRKGNKFKKAISISLIWFVRDWLLIYIRIFYGVYTRSNCIE